MDAVSVVEPLIEEAAPIVADVAEQAVKVLYATGDIIVIDAKDLKTFAIRTAVVVAYAGVVYWSWKKQVTPAIAEHKERKARKDHDKMVIKRAEREARERAAKAAKSAE